MEFKLNEYHRNVSDEELLKDIRRVAKALGKDSITRKEYEDNGGQYGITTFNRRFGGWINALKMSGLTPHIRQIYPTYANSQNRYITTEEELQPAA